MSAVWDYIGCVFIFVGAVAFAAAGALCVVRPDLPDLPDEDGAS